MLQQPITPKHLIPNFQDWALVKPGPSQALDLRLLWVQMSERPERRKSGAGVGGHAKGATPEGLGSDRELYSWLSPFFFPYSSHCIVVQFPTVNPTLLPIHWGLPRQCLSPSGPTYYLKSYYHLRRHHRQTHHFGAHGSRPFLPPRVKETKGKQQKVVLEKEKRHFKCKKIVSGVNHDREIQWSGNWNRSLNLANGRNASGR